MKVDVGFINGGHTDVPTQYKWAMRQMWKWCVFIITQMLCYVRTGNRRPMSYIGHIVIDAVS